MALVLSIRIKDGPIWIGDDIQVNLVGVDTNGQARLAITAPDHVEILRDKLKNKEQQDD